MVEALGNLKSSSVTETGQTTFPASNSGTMENQDEGSNATDWFYAVILFVILQVLMPASTLTGPRALYLPITFLFKSFVIPLSEEPRTPHESGFWPDYMRQT